MSESDQRPGPDRGAPVTTPEPTPPAPSPPAFANTPNAERYVLEADAMRRRQLRSALLHGSSKTWREHRRVWPAAAVGVIVAAVIIAGMAVSDALDTEQERKKEQEQQQKAQVEKQQQQEEEQKKRAAEQDRERREPSPAITSPTATATPTRAETGPTPPSP